MIEVKFYDEVDDAFLQFAVVISKTDGKWVFCRHRERDTYEIPVSYTHLTLPTK